MKLKVLLLTLCLELVWGAQNKTKRGLGDHYVANVYRPHVVETQAQLQVQPTYYVPKIVQPQPLRAPYEPEATKVVYQEYQQNAPPPPPQYQQVNPYPSAQTPLQANQPPPHYQTETVVNPIQHSAFIHHIPYLAQPNKYTPHVKLVYPRPQYHKVPVPQTRVPPIAYQNTFVPVVERTTPKPQPVKVQPKKEEQEVEEDEEEDDVGQLREDDEEEEPRQRSKARDEDDEEFSRYYDDDEEDHQSYKDDEDDEDSHRGSSRHYHKKHNSKRKSTKKPKKYQAYKYSKGSNGKPKIETFVGKASSNIPVSVKKVYREKWYITRNHNSER